MDTDNADLRNLFALSLERLGCQVAELVVRSGDLFDGGDPVHAEPVALALTAADLVIDTTGSLVAASSARAEILEQARVLAIAVHDIHDIDDLVAHPGLGRRLQRAAELLTYGSSLTIDSHSGTHVDVSLSGATYTSAAGVVLEPGDFEYWPAGLVSAHPGRGAVNGCVVAMPGDSIAEAGHLIRSPVRIEIENGLLTDVLGDSTDADIVRSQLEALDDPRAFHIAEIGWGMNLVRGDSELTVFDPARLGTGRGPLAAGRVNIGIGNAGAVADVGVTLSLGGTDLAIDDVELISRGVLAGVLAPDIYERAACR